MFTGYICGPFSATNYLNPGVPSQHTLPTTQVPGPVGLETLMRDTVATSSGAIACSKFASAQEPEVIILATEGTSQAVCVVKPAPVYHLTTGQEYEVSEATIAEIESFHLPEGFQPEESREGRIFTP